MVGESLIAETFRGANMNMVTSGRRERDTFVGNVVGWGPVKFGSRIAGLDVNARQAGRLDHAIGRRSQLAAVRNHGFVRVAFQLVMAVWLAPSQ